MDPLLPRAARPLLAFLAGAVACLCFVGVAAASRAPTRAEGKAIRRSVAGYASVPGSSVAKTTRVASIEVSTIDQRYAGVRLRSTTGGRAVMLLHRSFGFWWVQQVGASLRCDVAPKAILEDLKIGCRPPDGVAWIGNCSRLESEPASLVISCADGNYALVGLRWRTWGSATATATGTARVNDCQPDCAGGHFHDYAIMATASALTRCGATPVYGQLTITYAASSPRLLPKADRHRLGC